MTPPVRVPAPVTATPVAFSVKARLLAVPTASASLQVTVTVPPALATAVHHADAAMSLIASAIRSACSSLLALIATSGAAAGAAAKVKVTPLSSKVSASTGVPVIVIVPEP